MKPETVTVPPTEKFVVGFEPNVSVATSEETAAAVVVIATNVFEDCTVWSTFEVGLTVNVCTVTGLTLP